MAVPTKGFNPVVTRTTLNAVTLTGSLKIDGLNDTRCDEQERDFKFHLQHSNRNGIEVNLYAAILVEIMPKWRSFPDCAEPVCGRGFSWLRHPAFFPTLRHAIAWKTDTKSAEK